VTVSDAVRLAIGTRDRLVQVWDLDSKGKMQSVFSVQLNVTVPKAVAFAENRARDIYIFGLYDGNVHVLRGGDGKVLSTQDIGTIM
jgi:hypothetical protein